VTRTSRTLSPKCSPWGHWWLAFREAVLVAFAGLVPSAYAANAGYCGRSLQSRLMRAAEARARNNSWAAIISDTTDNVASANNFIRAGYQLHRPRHPWGWSHTLYWRKSVGDGSHVELAGSPPSAGTHLAHI
jgi:hypothetical protein